MDKMIKILIKLGVFLISINISFPITKMLFKLNIIESNYFMICLLLVIGIVILLSNKIKYSNRMKKHRFWWNTIILNVLNLLVIGILSNTIYFKSFDLFGKENLHSFVANDTISILNNNKELNNDMKEVLKKVCGEKNNYETDGEIDFVKVSEEICRDPKRTREIFNNDKNINKFNNYGIKIDEILDYCSNYNKLQTSLVFMGYYLGVFLFLIIIYYFHQRIFIADDYEEFKISMKRIIYLVALVIYLISFIDINNNGIASYMIQKGSDVQFNKEDLKYIIGFISTFKEAFLTFIIFDTVLECCDKLKGLKNKCDSNKEVKKVDNEGKRLYKKIGNVEEKYTNLKKRNIDIEEILKNQNRTINELKREIKNIKQKNT